MSVHYFASSSAQTAQPRGGRVTVGGVSFDDVTMDEARARIEGLISSGGTHAVCTGNVDHLYLLQSDALFRTVYAQSSLNLADGMPVLWLSRLARGEARLRERVAGSDLFWELARLSHEKGTTLFFLGGAPGSAEKAKTEVLARYPNAKIVGTHCPPLATFDTPEVQSEIQRQVREAAPDILLVGFGAPKQEKWIHHNREALRVPVSIGVGGTFEMAGGAVKRAPQWLSRVGLEWAFRFIQDPMRLYRRYFCHDMPFLLRLALQMWLGSSKNSVEDAPTRLPMV
jgi:N-acetylglucosaminyldiphosphoundecaprenol N-acetyl-beta-D-mannosaminyltransferase